MSTRNAITIDVVRRFVLVTAAYFLLLAVALFVPAGSIHWTAGWIFFGVFLVYVLASIVYLWCANPEIFAARSRIQPGTKAWDKLLLALLVPAFLALFPVAALDAAHFHWSTVPILVRWLGYVLFTAGYWISVWAYGVNKFAEPGVRIQSERHQQVIATGPYSIVRHPVYLGAFLLLVGVPLALDSYWALLPAAIGAVVLLVRTVLEDRLLHDQLPGYHEYATRVRYRIIPGVW